MQLSVIIPTKNEAPHIGPLIQYLRTHGGALVAEIIVVDANSTDQTGDLAQASGAHVIWSNTSSRAAQMNLGAQAAKSQVLYFVHADTIPPVSFARNIQQALSKGSVMGCFRYAFDSPLRILKFNAYFVRFKWLWCQGGDKTFFIKRAVFEEFDGYDARFVVMEEYDFLRKALKKYSLEILPQNVLVSARKYEQNSWLRVQLANLGAFAMFRWGAEPATIKRFYLSIVRH